MADIDCGSRSPDILVRDGPCFDVVVNNRSAANPIHKQLSALIDTGAEWNLIEHSFAAGVLHLKHIDDQWLQTAAGPALAPVYLAQLIIPNLIYSKVQRFVGANLGADRILLGREGLQDFVLNYSGRTGRVTLHY